jgi:hypothetical protein
MKAVNKKALAIGLALALAVTLAVYLYSAGFRDEPELPAVTALDPGSLHLLHTRFNVAQDSVRILLLLSPT